MFGSGGRGASTQSSSTYSDRRGCAVEKGFLVCHPFSHLFRLSTIFVGCLYVWREYLALLWADRVPSAMMSTFAGCTPVISY
jgi:hypothetical protein